MSHFLSRDFIEEVQMKVLFNRFGNNMRANSDWKQGEEAWEEGKTCHMNVISKQYIWLKLPFRKRLFQGLTVAPRYNEPRYNEDPVITNNIWKPGKITVKYVETNPAITNRFWWSQCTIYTAITNILSCSRSQQILHDDTNGWQAKHDSYWSR